MILEKEREILTVDKNLLKPGFLPLMELFYTIQGEGFHQGKAATFIRLAGCDVGCVWCDVKESWDAQKHPLTSVADMAAEAAAQPAATVVVTGGEPFIYDLSALTSALKEKNINTHIETSGAYPVTGTWDWICVSPKKFKAPIIETLSRANELKVIIFNKSDFDWAEKHREKAGADCKLFLQPEWSKAEKMIPLIVDYVKQHPEWQISLQVHKYMGIP